MSTPDSRIAITDKTAMVEYLSTEIFKFSDKHDDLRSLFISCANNERSERDESRTLVQLRFNSTLRNLNFVFF